MGIAKDPPGTNFAYTFIQTKPNQTTPNPPKK